MSNVDHPSHYNMGKIEAITVIEDWKLDFHLGSAVKYIARCDHKGNPVEDLEKAVWYIQREIQKRTALQEPKKKRRRRKHKPKQKGGAKQ